MNKIKRIGDSLKRLLPCSLLACMPFTASAQIENDEITVLEDDGTQEVIDVPEGLTHEVDSLLSLYYSQMYLTPDGDCNYRDENPNSLMPLISIVSDGCLTSWRCPTIRWSVNLSTAMLRVCAALWATG